jgi:tetratricopeptide (TPR) repeat protein
MASIPAADNLSTGWKPYAQMERVDGITTIEVVDLLSSLTEKNMVVREEASGRYRLLETIRDYGRSCLESLGEAGDLRNRHRDHFLAVAEESEPHMTGPGQAEWLHLLENEHDNLRAALEWCERSEEGGEPGLKLSAALFRFWDQRGYFGEGRERCAKALTHSGASHRTHVRARTLRGAGVLASYQGNNEESRSQLDEAMEIYREVGDRVGEAAALLSLGPVAVNEGDYLRAVPLYEQALAAFKDLGDRRGEALCLCNLGGIAEEKADLDEARRLHEESLTIFREIGDRDSEAYSLNNLGIVARRQGDFSQASSLQEQAIAILLDLQIPSQIAYCLYELGLCGEQAGRPERAVRLLAAADAVRASIGAPFKAYDREIIDSALARLRQVLGDNAFSTFLDSGSELTMEQAIELASEGLS